MYVGGILMSTENHLGCAGWMSAGPSRLRRDLDDLVSPTCEQGDQSFAHEETVIDDHQAHGTSIVSVVPWPAGCRSSGCRRPTRGGL